MKFTIGFSPCPNDTFIFDALINNKIDTEGITFDVRLEDVETLNRLALENTLDFTKISYGVLPLLLENYVVLNSGGALGEGVGPLLVSKNFIAESEIKNCLIAIPGQHTTAHMLFSLAFPEAGNKKFLRYDEIENFVLNDFSKNGKLENNIQIAGVIIHENRFTYQQKGLTKVVDLGEVWQQKIGSAIPLGGIVAKRDIHSDVLRKVDKLIRKSIEYAFSNYPKLTDYIRINSQEMEEDVMRKHIDLYVNNYSISLGEEGKNAVIQFIRIYKTLNNAENISEENIFL